MTIVTSLAKLAKPEELDKFIGGHAKSAIIVHNGQNFTIRQSSEGWVVASKGHIDSDTKNFNAALLNFSKENPYAYHLLSKNGYGFTWVDSMVAWFTGKTINAAAEERKHGESLLYSAANALERHSLGVSSTSFAEQRTHKLGFGQGLEQGHKAIARFRDVVRTFKTPAFDDLPASARLARLHASAYEVFKGPLQNEMEAVKAEFFAGKPDVDALVTLLAATAIVEVSEEKY